MSIGITARQNRDAWSPDRDALLMDAISEGMSFSDAARAVGTTKDAASKRFQRLRLRMGAQAI